MKNFINVLFVAFASVLTMPSQTMAAQPDYLSIFTRVAQQHFAQGTPPSCGQPRYEWHMRSAFDEIVKAPGAEGAAFEDGSCRVLFAKDTWGGNPLNMCTTVVHEIGHLYGYDHTETGAMALTGRDNYPCVGMFYKIRICKRDRDGGSGCKYTTRLRKGIA